MTALAASETAMYALTGSETMWAAVVASSTAMKAVAGSETAMQCVCGDEVAMKAVVESETAMAVIGQSEAIEVKFLAALAGYAAYIEISDYAGLVANSPAFAAVVSNETAMRIVAASENAMAAVAVSKVALRIIMSVTAAMEAVETSETATAALAASPLKTSSVYTCRTNMWTYQNTKSLYLISAKQSVTNSTSHLFYVSPTARDNRQIYIQASLCYNKEYAYNHFMRKLNDYTNYTSNVNVTYTYILLD